MGAGVILLKKKKTATRKVGGRVRSLLGGATTAMSVRFILIQELTRFRHCILHICSPEFKSTHMFEYLFQRCAQI